VLLHLDVVIRAHASFLPLRDDVRLEWEGSERGSVDRIEYRFSRTLELLESFGIEGDKAVLDLIIGFPDAKKGAVP